MPNTNRPDTTDCDCGDLCTSCGCSECGRKVDTLGPLTLVSGRVVQACAECRAEDTGGVPVAVKEGETVRETMTIELRDGYLVEVLRSGASL